MFSLQIKFPLTIPKSFGYTAIGLSLAVVVTVCIEYWFVPKKYWPYVPNWICLDCFSRHIPPHLPSYRTPSVSASSFLKPTTLLPWLLDPSSNSITGPSANPKSFDLYMFAIAASLLAGEGLGGVFNALLAVIGVDGGKFGTAIGCPGFEFCG
ncbi:hypothetical protein V5O48_014290 [Marasmius crinis-equi]|uniref:Uncharacterized protein n=1 Tax=Marasmius crinis-equi TaxID=585013 RepID=A0ABR3EXR6_9AGAR